MNETINYKAYKIQVARPVKYDESGFISSKEETDQTVSFVGHPFAEIEIECGIKSSHEPLPIHQSTDPSVDEKRRIFTSMRDISRFNHSSYFANSKFYQKQAQYENSKIFYKQAVFMKDFEDDFAESVPFSAYFPYYQMMSYEQLRTYFTWRTKVRSGNVQNTSLSYAFVYIYELLNNIGVNDPLEGLEKLMSFRASFKAFDTTIEKYLIKWIKDYHIYYELPWSFKEFIFKNELQSHYPDIAGYQPEASCHFERFCGISKYNIRQSAFYSDKTNELITECFDFVIGKLKIVFLNAGIEIDNLIFQHSKTNSVWTPFNGALFYPTLKQSDREIVLCENEIYICSQNRWFFSTVIPVESGKQLIGYILKRMEAVLRKVTNYKYKLSSDLNMISNEVQKMLATAGISLEKAVTDFVLEFYREKNKTVVSVNKAVLDKIRLEALDTQQKLIVPENIITASPFLSELSDNNKVEEEPFSAHFSETSLSDGWAGLRDALNEIEINALSEVLKGNRDIKQFADENGVMLEVLADSINEKAFDHIGDNILDECIIIYDEYREKTMIMVESFLS